MGNNLPGASQCIQLGKNSDTSHTFRSPHTLLLFYKNSATPNGIGKRNPPLTPPRRGRQKLTCIGAGALSVMASNPLTVGHAGRVRHHGSHFSAFINVKSLVLYEMHPIYRELD